MSYTEQHLYSAILPFGTYDVSKLIETCNQWDISPSEVIFYIQDNFPEQNPDDMNVLFHAAYCVRLLKLHALCEKLRENYTLPFKTALKLTRLVHYIEDYGLEKISVNYANTCFDCNILNAFNDCTTSDQLLCALLELSKNSFQVN